MNIVTHMRKQQPTQVIFVRAELDLVSALEARLQEEREENPGQKISRSDLARRLMYAGLDRKKQPLMPLKATISTLSDFDPEVGQGG